MSFGLCMWTMTFIGVNVNTQQQFKFLPCLNGYILVTIS
jgi:hypothetical protein